MLLINLHNLHIDFSYTKWKGGKKRKKKNIEVRNPFHKENYKVTFKIHGHYIFFCIFCLSKLPLHY